MPNALEQRRERWLRRTSLITGWIAALAVAATLLIAAVVSSASPVKKVAIGVQRPLSRPAQVRRRQAVVHRRTRVHRTVHVVHKVAKVTPTPTPTPTTPTPTPPPAPPAPAPVTPPVVVSGGS